MRNFMLILRGDTTTDFGEMSPDDMQQVIAEYEAWAGKLAGLGLLHGGEKLTDHEGRRMLPKGAGKVEVLDGPFQEAKEVVGGYYLISAESYDHAVELCQGHPNFRFGSIEIREVDAIDAGSRPEGT